MPSSFSNRADPADLEILDWLIQRTKTAGADAIDAILVRGQSMSLAQRLREPEFLERSEGQEIGLRALVGARQAIISTSDLRPEALEPLAERVVAMAREVPEDEFIGLADLDQFSDQTNTKALENLAAMDMLDSSEITDAELISRAKICEEAALNVEGVTNSEGAQAGWSRQQIVLSASNGFSGGYSVSNHWLAASVLAGSGTEMERDYHYMSCVYLEDLEDPAEIGRKAGEKTVSRLGARRVKTGQVPVVFDRRVASSLLGHLAGAINGASIARGTSFLKDHMGKSIFAKGVNVIDDPHRRRGLSSRPFDGEGLANQPLNLIKDGILSCWLLDLRSARKLGLHSNARASRGVGSVPSPSTTNLYMQPGPLSPDELISDIKTGFYVTELLGMGVNMITGDYSRGASGFWIENGERIYPVSELTIAGNLKEMYQTLTPAHDLEFRYGTNAPSVRIEGMTVAGN